MISTLADDVSQLTISELSIAVAALANIGGVGWFVSKIHSATKRNETEIEKLRSETVTKLASIEATMKAELAAIEARHLERMAEIKVDLKTVEKQTADQEVALARVIAKIN
tara:strand:- start:9560 stop:9892 length:333 start_codon:yes stop_codon:yes gene_type:complete